MRHMLCTKLLNPVKRRKTYIQTNSSLITHTQTFRHNKVSLHGNNFPSLIHFLFSKTEIDLANSRISGKIVLLNNTLVGTDKYKFTSFFRILVDMFLCLRLD